MFVGGPGGFVARAVGGGLNDGQAQFFKFFPAAFGVERDLEADDGVGQRGGIGLLVSKGTQQLADVASGQHAVVNGHGNGACFFDALHQVVNKARLHARDVFLMDGQGDDGRPLGLALNLRLAQSLEFQKFGHAGKNQIGRFGVIYGGFWKDHGRGQISRGGLFVNNG